MRHALRLSPPSEDVEGPTLAKGDELSSHSNGELCGGNGHQ
jgi:hypothetical protein